MQSLLRSSIRRVAAGSAPRIVFFCFVGLFVIASRGEGFTKLITRDFIAFWASSYLALAGDAAAAFDVARTEQVHLVALGQSFYVPRWHYPPTYQLLIMPIALLPYIAAWFVWIGTTLAAYLIVLRKFAPHRDAVLLLFAFPPVFANMYFGQNGFLVAAIFGGALLALRSRPILAGALFGILSIKPHLALLVPLALVAAGQWRAFMAAVLASLLLIMASFATLGSDAWLAFFHDMPNVRPLIDGQQLPHSLMPTTYVGLIRLGVTPDLAMTIHVIQVVVVAALVAVVWRHAQLPVASAALIGGAVLIPPYLFLYDLTLLAIPIFIITADIGLRGWPRAEMGILAAAWLAPGIAWYMKDSLVVPIGPLSLLALFAIIVWRALRYAVTSPQTAAATATTLVPSQ